MREKGSRRRGKGGNPSRCADVLEGTLQGLGLGRVTRHLALLKAWDRAIAPRVRERASVEDFKEGRLYLCVEDPIWLHELHMLRHKLKTILNEELGEAVVGEIVLRIGRTARPSQRQNAQSTITGSSSCRSVRDGGEDRAAPEPA